MRASARHWRGVRGWGGQTLRACGGLLQLEISGQSWSPSQGGWHLQNALYHHPQHHVS